LAWTCFASCYIKLLTQIWFFEKFAQKFFWEILKFSWKNVKIYSKVVCVRAGELKICMNMLYYECFKAWFSDFEILDICGGFLEKIANSLVCNLRKVDTRPTSASIFFKLAFIENFRGMPLDRNFFTVNDELHSIFAEIRWNFERIQL
jgi:hypothetical protein